MAKSGIPEGRGGPADDVDVVLPLAADGPRGRDADIGAVQAQPDAPDHLAHVLLSQVAAGVGDARLRAIIERVDGRGQQAGVDVEANWADTVWSGEPAAYGPERAWAKGRS
jgi:hypothetical protein